MGAHLVILAGQTYLAQAKDPAGAKDTTVLESWFHAIERRSTVLQHCEQYCFTYRKNVLNGITTALRGNSVLHYVSITVSCAADCSLMKIAAALRGSSHA